MTHRSDRLGRRDFLRTGSAALIAPVFAHPVWAELARIPSVPRTTGNTRVLHICSYAHIDAAWLWPWRDSADEAIRTTQSATDRLAETPDLRYSQTSAAYYRWVEEADPRLFEVVKRDIASGRFEVINGWIVEPDCNIPATESVVRQSLYGKRYFKSRFGGDVVVGANPDSFGHAAGFPQLLRRAGYKYYCFSHPKAQEMPGVPIVFQWAAPDGSRVLTARLEAGYVNDGRGIPNEVAHVFQPGLDHAMYWIGIGDHGGGPTKEHIALVIALRSDPKLPELRFSTVKEFFLAVEQSRGYTALPVVRTELQHYARGCYSSYGAGKALNRRAERGLGSAETAAVVAQLAAEQPYDAAAFAQAWWDVCFCQCHDMMAGTAISSDYVQVRDAVGAACQTAETRKVRALEALARRVDLTSIPTSALFVFNTLPWPRTATVAIRSSREMSDEDDKDYRDDVYEATYLIAPDGSRILIQRRTGAGWDKELWARVPLPACGYTVYAFGADAPPSPPEQVRSVASPNGNNRALEVFGLNSIGVGAGLSRVELLASRASLVVVADHEDAWGDIAQWREELGRPVWTATEEIEHGPLAWLTRQTAKWRDSMVVLDIEQVADSPIVSLRFVIDWHEQAQMLKLEFPTALVNPRVFAKVAGAAIERNVDGTEESMQDWVAVEGTIGGHLYTLAVMNRQSYAYDCMRGLLRITLIRSAPFADWSGDGALMPNAATNFWMDQGRQERQFWITTGAGPHRGLNLDRLAEEWQSPAETVMDSHHPGTAPRRASYLTVEPSSVWVTAVKRAEDGDALIVRFQERAGVATNAVVSSEAFGWRHDVKVGPWEIATLRIDSASTSEARSTAVTLLETT